MKLVDCILWAASAHAAATAIRPVVCRCLPVTWTALLGELAAKTGEEPNPTLPFEYGGIRFERLTGWIPSEAAGFALTNE